MFKKLTLTGLALLLLVSPTFVLAQSQDTDVQAQIQSLLAQIKQLQTLIAQIQSGSDSSVLTCSSFSDVSYGNFDNNPGGRVSQLQTWLGIPSNAFGFGTYGHKTQVAWKHQCSGTQRNNETFSATPTVSITNISGRTITIQYSNLVSTELGATPPRSLWVQNSGMSNPTLRVDMSGAPSGTMSFTLPVDARDGHYTISPVGIPTNPQVGNERTGYTAYGKTNEIISASFYLSTNGMITVSGQTSGAPNASTNLVINSFQLSPASSVSSPILIWATSNAAEGSCAIFRYTSQPQGTATASDEAYHPAVPTSGSLAVVNGYYYRLGCSGSHNGDVATATRDVDLLNGVLTSGAQVVSIDQSSLVTANAHPIITGTAQNLDTIAVAVTYSGKLICNSDSIPVVNNRWSYTACLPGLDGLSDGTYQVQVSALKQVFATGTLDKNIKNSTVPIATIDSVTSTSGNFSVTGSAYHSGAVIVTLVSTLPNGSAYGGGTDWNTIGGYLKGTPFATTAEGSKLYAYTSPVTNPNRYTVNFQNIPAGNYRILVHNSDYAQYALMAMSTMWVGPQQ